MSEKKVRYGIIGFGGFAERAIAPAIRGARNSELVAIQKRSLDAAQQKAAALGVPHAFSSAQDLAAHPDVDAVFIVSPNAGHAPETIIAAKAGKHVLVEKPIALDCAEAQRMIDECKARGVKLMVGHMVRLSPVVTRMKELIRSGSIGAVQYIRSEFVYDARLSARSWLFDRALAGGGPLYDIAVHCIDTIRFLLDDDVVSVAAQLDPIPTAQRTESTAALSLRFAGGVAASVFTSYASPVRRSFLEVVCSEGTLSAENFTKSAITTDLRIVRRSGSDDGEEIRETIRVHDLYVDEVERFSDCILKNSPSPVPGEEGLKNQRVLDEAMRLGGR